MWSDPGNLTSAIVCGDRNGSKPAAKRSARVGVGTCRWISGDIHYVWLWPTLAHLWCWRAWEEAKSRNITSPPPISIPWPPPLSPSVIGWDGSHDLSHLLGLLSASSSDTVSIIQRSRVRKRLRPRPRGSQKQAERRPLNGWEAKRPRGGQEWKFSKMSNFR